MFCLLINQEAWQKSPSARTWNTNTTSSLNTCQKPKSFRDHWSVWPIYWVLIWGVQAPSNCFQWANLFWHFFWHSFLILSYMSSGVILASVPRFETACAMFFVAAAIRSRRLWPISDILFWHSSDIFSDISGVLPDMYSDVLFDIFLAILTSSPIHV